MTDFFINIIPIIGIFIHFFENKIAQIREKIVYKIWNKIPMTKHKIQIMLRIQIPNNNK